MNQKNRQDRSVLVLLLVVIVLSAFIYKNYRDNLTSSEEIGAYISKNNPNRPPCHLTKYGLGV